MTGGEWDPRWNLLFSLWQKAQQYGYDQSLMARLQRHLEEQVQRNMLHSLPVVQLTVQYRMHPDICLFPSNYVYGRTLKTAKWVAVYSFWARGYFKAIFSCQGILVSLEMLEVVVEGKVVNGRKMCILSLLVLRVIGEVRSLKIMHTGCWEFIFRPQSIWVAGIVKDSGEEKSEKLQSQSG